MLIESNINDKNSKNNIHISRIKTKLCGGGGGLFLK